MAESAGLVFLLAFVLAFLELSGGSVTSVAAMPGFDSAEDLAASPPAAGFFFLVAFLTFFLAAGFLPESTALALLSAAPDWGAVAGTGTGMGKTLAKSEFTSVVSDSGEGTAAGWANGSAASEVSGAGPESPVSELGLLSGLPDAASAEFVLSDEV